MNLHLDRRDWTWCQLKPTSISPAHQTSSILHPWRRFIHSGSKRSILHAQLLLHLRIWRVQETLTGKLLTILQWTLPILSIVPSWHRPRNPSQRLMGLLQPQAIHLWCIHQQVELHTQIRYNVGFSWNWGSCSTRTLQDSWVRHPLQRTWSTPQFDFHCPPSHAWGLYVSHSPASRGWPWPLDE